MRKSDFAGWKGHLVKMETSILVVERKRFKGKIAEADEDGVLIEREAAYGEEPAVRVPYETIAEARLILTDDLVRDALSKDNRARKEAKRHRGELDEESAASDETENDN